MLQLIWINYGAEVRPRRCGGMARQLALLGELMG